jgi:hypothetical protein
LQTSFSNIAQSLKVVLGFMQRVKSILARKVAKIRWFEKGINSNARERAVVIHGAKYVSNSFIQNNKRLGRSLGCPASP